jgi:hypothetical protein
MALGQLSDLRICCLTTRYPEVSYSRDRACVVAEDVDLWRSRPRERTASSASTTLHRHRGPRQRSAIAVGSSVGVRGLAQRVLSGSRRPWLGWRHADRSGGDSTPWSTRPTGCTRSCPDAAIPYHCDLPGSRAAATRAPSIIRDGCAPRLRLPTDVAFRSRSVTAPAGAARTVDGKSGFR